jgi:hypothetical protein
VLPWAGEIIQLVLGAAYAGGAFTLMVMFLYPVHQSLGQIGGSLLYATGHTRIQAVLGMGFMFVSFITAYFMMAPADAIIPGLGLGSNGLAYKMVILQVIQINIMTWYIARLFQWKYDWSYQIIGLMPTVAAGWTAKILIGFMVAAAPLVQMISGTVIYLLLVAGLLYFFPFIAGIERHELKSYLSRR